ncbi:MAG: NAD-dependent epimerase/dehydratase family protein [Lentisphaerota bacterium]
MSRCLVTGAAGFIGSHLCEALLAKGHEVVGLDAFIPYYPRPLKENNLQAVRQHKAFTFHEGDLREADLKPLVDGCDVVFHEAAMAGLMRSWSDFNLYASCNMLGTQRLLDAVRDMKVPQFIHVSTSSVYGREAAGAEDMPLTPFSPYGITKVGAEQLCRAYEANFGVPVTVLRYFSVYGPRQRPDMAYNILIRCLFTGEAFSMFGDGTQTRSNTFVKDCVNATMLAFEKRGDAVGETFNVGGGEIVSLNKVIGILEELTGRKVNIERKPSRPGDQQHTSAHIAKIKAKLGYSPVTSVRTGLQAQLEWQKPLLGR